MNTDVKSLSLWILLSTSSLVVAIIVALFFYRKNQKLRRQEIEWKIGRETDQKLDYDCFSNFFCLYEALKGKRVDFIKYGMNRFQKLIDKANSLDDLLILFKGFQYDNLLIEETHNLVAEVCQKTVLDIAEDAWENILLNENSVIRYRDVLQFKDKIKSHCFRVYELSENFHERIKKFLSENDGEKEKTKLQVIT